ncbi:MAG: LamG-like jellyroll fold domain-containing protein [Planctomycetota bacterium]|jgi:hypothetical protein
MRITGYHLAVFLMFATASGCASAPSERGLVGHWAFDQLISGGTRTPDASGRGRHARVYGQPLVEGVVGKAIRMEAFPEQIVELGDLGLRAPMTVSFWFWTRDLFRDRMVLAQMDGAANPSGALRFDGGQLEVLHGGTWERLIRDGLRITRWMHVAVVYGADGVTTGYLDGRRANAVACDADFTGRRTAIGAPVLGERGNVFSGRLDEFRVYNRSLGVAEIERLAGAARKGR